MQCEHKSQRTEQAEYKKYFASNSNSTTSNSSSINKDLFVCTLSKILIGHLVGTWCCCCTCFNTSGNLVQNCIVLCCCRRRHYHRWRTFLSLLLSLSIRIYNVCLCVCLRPSLGPTISSGNLCFKPGFVCTSPCQLEKHIDTQCKRFSVDFPSTRLHMVSKCVL